METYHLKAALLYALSATQQTTILVDEFLQNASFANEDLDSLMYELFDLRTPLERLGDSDLVIPTRLQPPILAVVRGCGDALARVNAVLSECTNGPLRDAIWTAKAPKVCEFKKELQTCRRALQLSMEVVNLYAPSNLLFILKISSHFSPSSEPPMLTGCRAAAKDVGADAETFTTYLDQDTSRVLALIRRTLQQVQGNENEKAFILSLRQPLDDIRLYVQYLCRSPTVARYEARPASSPPITVEPHIDMYDELVSPTS